VLLLLMSCLNKKARRNDVACKAIIVLSKGSNRCKVNALVIKKETPSIEVHNNGLF